MTDKTKVRCSPSRQENNTDIDKRLYRLKLNKS